MASQAEPEPDEVKALLQVWESTAKKMPRSEKYQALCCEQGGMGAKPAARGFILIPAHISIEIAARMANESDRLEQP